MWSAYKPDRNNLRLGSRFSQVQIVSRFCSSFFLADEPTGKACASGLCSYTNADKENITGTCRSQMSLAGTEEILPLPWHAAMQHTESSCCRP